jgi:hypothetical protein
MKYFKIKVLNSRKPEVTVYALVLLGMIVALLPMIYKKVYSYFFYGYYNIESVLVIMLIFSMSFSLWLWFIGLSAKNWLKGIPLFIGGTALIFALYFLPIEDGHNINWHRALFLIFTAWVMLHLEYCLPISDKTRIQISATILLIGIPIAPLAILLSAFGNAFGSGLPATTGIIFFPAVILGPFVFLLLARSLLKKALTRSPDSENEHN